MLSITGRLYHGAGDYTKGESFYQRAVAIFEKVTESYDPLHLASLLNYFGMLHNERETS